MKAHLSSLGFISGTTVVTPAAWREAKGRKGDEREDGEVEVLRVHGKRPPGGRRGGRGIGTAGTRKRKRAAGPLSTAGAGSASAGSVSAGSVSAGAVSTEPRSVGSRRGRGHRRGGRGRGASIRQPTEVPAWLKDVQAVNEIPKEEGKFEDPKKSELFTDDEVDDFQLNPEGAEQGISNTGSFPPFPHPP